MTPSQIWYAAAILLFVLEMITPGFVLANIAVAALAAGVTAEFGGSLIWQLGVFALVGMVSYFTVRPLLRRALASTDTPQASGVDALLGRVVIVTETITSDGTQGRVQVDGDSWRAISLRATQMESGTHVRICGIESTILVAEELTT